jgi:hypothetical protein
MLDPAETSRHEGRGRHATNTSVMDEEPGFALA